MEHLPRLEVVHENVTFDRGRDESAARHDGETRHDARAVERFSLDLTEPSARLAIENDGAFVSRNHHAISSSLPDP